MSGILASFLSSGRTTLLVLGGITAAAAAWGVRFYLNSRPTPAELERRRRAKLYSRGKMGVANLLEYREQTVFFSYDIGGVEYTACQELADLQPLLPADVWSTIGPVAIRYDPRNPANSIVISEEWSGLRRASAKLKVE